jgi:hypothetical protein
MTIPDQPPRGLRWTTTDTARGLTTIVAMLALLLGITVCVQQQVYIHCVGARQAADAKRTAAISHATDVERAADRDLLDGPRPGGPTLLQLRDAAVAARAHTDVVRAANPPEQPGAC